VNTFHPENSPQSICMKFVDLFITYINRSILWCKILSHIISQFSGQRTLDLLSARWQRSACKAKRAINCPLTRLIDRNKLRSIYIFLKNSNLSTNDFITSDFTIIKKVLHRIFHREVSVEMFRLMIQLFRAIWKSRCKYYKYCSL